MPVTTVTKDPVALTMTVSTDLDATPERVWQLWADPRQLERWWGPPGYPATFTTHDFRAGGRSEYHMTGPDGPTPAGYWEIIELDPPRSMKIEDGFAEGGPKELEGLSGGMKISIEDLGGGKTRMSILNEFPSAEAMEQLLQMGQEEGMREAMGQIDAILAESVPA